MWGELYTRFEPLQQLADMFLPLNEEFPDDGLYVDEEEAAEELTGDWIARLSPRPHHLIEAHRRFWDRLCGESARQRGYSRWGFKAVNVPIDYPVYLKRLYPDARILFLIRNPYRAWLSYRRYGNWYASFPDDPVFTVQRFARLWSDNVEGFLELEEDIDALLIRFEDLVEGGSELSRLSDYLGTVVDPEVLEMKVSGTSEGSADRTNPVEKAVLRKIAGRQADRLGYEPV